MSSSAKKLILTAIVFITFIFLAIHLSISAKDTVTPKVLRGYVSSKDIKGYYANYKRLSDPEPEWKPAITNSSENSDLIEGHTGLIVDLDTNKIIYSKNAFEKMKIASLTKVMTAVVAVEHADINLPIVVSSKAATIGENVMGVSAGETYTLNELLYGLFLASGNDAAYAIAEGVAGDSDTFVTWMNIKAQELGLKDTIFYDPSGLDDRTTSTASDLVKLSRYAINSMDIRRVGRATEIELSSDTHKYIYLENQTNLLKTYPGVEGLKTGYTEEAGLCLITLAKNEGHELLGVVLNSIDRKGDMVLMLDYAFGTYGLKFEHHLLDK